MVQDDLMHIFVVLMQINMVHEAELRIKLRAIKKIEEIRTSSIAMMQDDLMHVVVVT